MPWVQLEQQPLPASRNILLNYTSPAGIVSLFRALSAGHFLVVFGISGSFFLKILILVSTGLLSLQSQKLTSTSNLLGGDDFNLSRSTFGSSANPVNSGVELWAITQCNAPYQPGTTAKLATQSYSAHGTGETAFSFGQSLILFSSRIRRHHLGQCLCLQPCSKLHHVRMDVQQSRSLFVG